MHTACLLYTSKYLIVFNDFKNEMLLLEMLAPGETSGLDQVQKAIQDVYKRQGFIIFKGLDKIHGLRVSKRVEEEGLDIYEHGESAYGA